VLANPGLMPGFCFAATAGIGSRAASFAACFAACRCRAAQSAVAGLSLGFF